jgi:hypothetical protein
MEFLTFNVSDEVGFAQGVGDGLGEETKSLPKKEGVSLNWLFAYLSLITNDSAMNVSRIFSFAAASIYFIC